MIKIPKNIVMIIGHEHPKFLIDTAESIRYFNNNNNYEIVFAIDFNKQTSAYLQEKYGRDRVFVSIEKNGWGRGILRTIVHALDYFNGRMGIKHVITMDSDALCVGPFIDLMLKKAENPDVFWVGSIWHTPGRDFGFHRRLRASGFMGEYNYNFRTEMCAGPCMMWTNHCFKFMKHVGLLPGKEFDKRYHLIHFAHDQISTYLIGCGMGKIENVGHLMEMRWRQSLPTINVLPWGNVPATHSHTAIIHPTKSNLYTEENCRDYFKSKRKIRISL